MMNKNEKIYLTGLLVAFLAGSILIGVYLVKNRTFRLPWASGCDTTGKWQINTNISSPMSMSQSGIATISQNSSGAFTGTLTDSDGSNPRPFTGQLTGDHFKTNPTVISGTMMFIDYEGTMTLDGTINNSCNLISGNISGQITTPSNETISGTFTATKTEGPTTTATPTLTSRPTINTTPTPHISTTTPASTATPGPSYTVRPTVYAPVLSSASPYYPTASPFSVPQTGGLSPAAGGILGTGAILTLVLLLVAF